MKIKHIDVEVQPDSEEKRIICRAVFIVQDVKEGLFFHLNKELEIKTLIIEQEGKKEKLALSKGENKSDFFKEESNKWIVKLPEKYHNSSELKFEINYQGTIKQDEPYKTNYVKREAIELAIYVKWYPIIEIDETPSFRVKLSKTENWSWIMNAPKIREDKNEIIWERVDQATDLTLIGRPNETCITRNESKIFWGDKQYFGKFKLLEEEILAYKEKLEEWFGKPKNDNFIIAINSRESGGTYVRQGLISTQGNLPNEYFIEKKRLLLVGWMHEISHLWFAASEKSTYHNWIDEAIADYCALLLSEEFFGKEFFYERLEKVKELLVKEETLPKIKEITRAHEKSYFVFYKWGSLILHEIREEIGLQSFLWVLRDFAEKSRTIKVVKTHHFVESLNKFTKEDWKNRFDRYLTISPTIDI